jgi:transposase
LSDVHELLSDYTGFADELVAMGVLRAVSPGPVRLYRSKWEKLYLSRLLSVNLEKTRAGKILYETGKNVSWWYRFFSRLIDEGDMLIYDVSSVTSYSEGLKLAEKGHNTDHDQNNQVRVLLAFSTGKGLPVAMDVGYGSMKDIKTIRGFLDNLPRRGRVGLILDRGFSGYRFFDDLNEEGIDFIVPLHKDFKIIPERVEWSGYMEYHGRNLRYAQAETRYGTLHMFEDPLLMGDQLNILTRNMASGGMSVEDYEKRRRMAGIIPLLTNTGLKSPQVYDLYKTRGEVEQAFDSVKNYLDTDTTYMQRPETVRGLMFVTFLASRIYFNIIKRLYATKNAGEYSVEEVLFELGKIEKLVDNKTGHEQYLRIPAKAVKILDLFKDQIPMEQK